MAGRAKRVRTRKAKVLVSGGTAESAAVDINLGTPVVVMGTPYGKMVEVMKQLAMRGQLHESIVMRIANAGGIAPVSDYIRTMRVYQKKHKK